MLFHYLIFASAIVYQTNATFFSHFQMFVGHPLFSHCPSFVVWSYLHFCHVIALPHHTQATYAKENVNAFIALNNFSFYLLQKW